MDFIIMKQWFGEAYDELEQRVVPLVTKKKQKKSQARKREEASHKMRHIFTKHAKPSSLKQQAMEVEDDTAQSRAQTVWLPATRFRTVWTFTMTGLMLLYAVIIPMQSSFLRYGSSVYYSSLVFGYITDCFF